MERIQCCHCGGFFPPSPRHRNQAYCMKPQCRRVRRAIWQRHKMKTDPDYRLNQGLSQKQWVRANAGYWKAYRQKNPDKAQRNRILQTIRNRKARGQPFDPSLIAKMGASKSDSFEVLGQFWMVPVIAKMDALRVNILKIPAL